MYEKHISHPGEDISVKETPAPQIYIPNKYRVGFVQNTHGWQLTPTKPFRLAQMFVSHKSGSIENAIFRAAQGKHKKTWFPLSRIFSKKVTPFSIDSKYLLETICEAYSFDISETIYLKEFLLESPESLVQFSKFLKAIHTSFDKAHLKLAYSLPVELLEKPDLDKELFQQVVSLQASIFKGASLLTASSVFKKSEKLHLYSLILSRFLLESSAPTSQINEALADKADAVERDPARTRLVNVARENYPPLEAPLSSFKNKDEYTTAVGQHDLFFVHYIQPVIEKSIPSYGHIPVDENQRTTIHGINQKHLLFNNLVDHRELPFLVAKNISTILKEASTGIPSYTVTNLYSLLATFYTVAPKQDILNGTLNLFNAATYQQPDSSDILNRILSAFSQIANSKTLSMFQQAFLHTLLEDLVRREDFFDKDIAPAVLDNFLANMPSFTVLIFNSSTYLTSLEELPQIRNLLNAFPLQSDNFWKTHLYQMLGVYVKNRKVLERGFTYAGILFNALFINPNLDISVKTAPEVVSQTRALFQNLHTPHYLFRDKLETLLPYLTEKLSTTLALDTPFWDEINFMLENPDYILSQADDLIPIKNIVCHKR